MIKVYEPTEVEFNHNGLKILHPRKAEIYIEDNGEYYIDIESTLDDLEYLQEGMIVRTDTRWGEQGFRLKNPQRKNNKISVRGNHLWKDSSNYIIADSYVVNKQCNDALDQLNRDISKTGSSYTFNFTDAERTALRNSCTTANSRTVTFYVRTTIGSNTYYSTINKTLSIVNATPTFTSSNLSYKDSNSTTVAVTGNNQHMVQSLSNLLVTISAATAKKGASITKYDATINGVTKSITAAGNIDYGKINSGSNLTLSVKVTDSRGNTATATKTVTFLSWSLPTALISLKRKNNYENETYLKVDGSISSVNSKNTMTIQYQYKKTTETSYSSLATLSDNVQVTMTKDKESAWDFKIIIKDKFGTTTYNTVLPKGRFILFVDTKKLSVGVNCFPTKTESLEVNGVQMLEYDEIASW